MMSPDGKWVWNGQQWLPVAVHESVFPAYTDATAAVEGAPPVPMAAPSPFPPVQAMPVTAAPAVMSPVIAPPIRYGAGGSPPPWQAPGGGIRTNYLYAGAAFLVVVIGVAVTILFTQSWLPFLRASGNPNTPTATPATTPSPSLAVRSEFAVAGRYVESVVTPSTSNLGPPIAAYFTSCNATLSFSCKDALTANDTELKKSIAAFAGTHPPSCILRQVTKVQADLNAMEAAVQVALKAYKDNNRNELLQGLAQFRTAYRPYTADVQAVTKVQAAACDGQPEGP
jgi:hypothetical protein